MSALLRASSGFPSRLHALLSSASLLILLGAAGLGGCGGGGGGGDSAGALGDADTAGLPGDDGVGAPDGGDAGPGRDTPQAELGPDVPGDTGAEADVDPAVCFATNPDGFGCPCTVHSDCPTGYCMPSAAGRTCTRGCRSVFCPTGYDCLPVDTALDTVFLCVERATLQCRPCRESSECPDPALPLVAWCRAAGAAGAFCANGCSADVDCPSGHVCLDSTTAEGDARRLCAPAAGDCVCSPRAIAAAAETDCANENEFGACHATRSCAADGLTACAAPVPAAEVCDGLDNDCDGATDEDIGGPTPIGDPCNLDEDGDGAPDDVDCAPFDAAVGSCDDGNPCTDDLCNERFGVCSNPPRTGSCEDGDLCTTAETCTAGVCGGGRPLDPDDGDPCTADGCDPATGVWHAPASDVPCEDGDPCTIGERCYGGLCAGGAPNPCDDGSDCTSDACEPAAGGCVHTPREGLCDDGTACTVGDRCVAGVCVPGTATVCDDGDVCTDDACDPATGACNYPPTTDPAIVDAPELCNGGDDNCDGLVDAADPVLLAEPCERQAGVCADVLKPPALCVAGAWLPCAEADYAAAADGYETGRETRCDGRDNDCDGQTDDDFSLVQRDQQVVHGAGTPCGAGVCAGGVTVCSGLDAIVCPGEAQAVSEICNGLDDDCDGATDEDLGQVLCGLGPCEHWISACEFAPDAVCDPFAGAAAEQCDGADNDCDGVADNDPVDAGVVCPLAGLLGRCGQGESVCIGGQLGCVQVNWPGDETCNGQDDDCDGRIDEGNPGGGAACTVPGLFGRCAAGLSECQSGNVRCAQVAFPTAESCNNVDDDCDGQTDDNVPGGGTPCTVAGLLGSCAAGETQCRAGQFLCVQTVFASAEACNGADDDCDGDTDEGAPGGGAACTVPGLQGPCATGLSACVDGTLACNQTVFPSDEACNGRDDDCDGRVDDGNPGGGAVCTVPGLQGRCARGLTECQTGTVQCAQTQFPTTEVCANGIDDDCDGQTDVDCR